MNKLTLTVPVAEGRCQFTDAQLSAIRNYLARHRTVSVTFERPRSTRSLQQNKRYWAILTLIAHETGHATEELHVAFRDMLLPRKFIKIGNRELEVAKTTTDLSPAEFTEYVERVVAEAAQMGIVITEAI